MDDEAGITEQAKIFLEREDDKFNVITANSVNKGLEILEENEFDVVISDYKMPGKGGLDFLNIIRAEKDMDTPFILLTGKGEKETIKRANEIGADEYLTKKGNPISQYSKLADVIIRETA